jgi:hypothetical protein
MQCQLNIPSGHNIEWIATFSDDSFDKVPVKKVNFDYMFDVDNNHKGILVSYNAGKDSYIGAYPIQKRISVK